MTKNQVIWLFVFAITLVLNNSKSYDTDVLVKFSADTLLVGLILEILWSVVKYGREDNDGKN